MSFHSLDTDKFDRWKRDLANAHQHAGWNKYDDTVRRTVSAFDQFLCGRAGYIGPRWQLIKAVLWVEGGGPGQTCWNTQPMQIGWLNDPGIIDVLTKPHIGLVTPPDIRRRFGMAAIKEDPEVNIQAGISLLHLKLALFSQKPRTMPTLSSMEQIGTETITTRRATEALSRLEVPSTSDWQRSPHHLKHHRSIHLEGLVTESYISAWLPFCPVTVYQRYNIGDGAYASKLEYCMELMAGQA